MAKYRVLFNLTGYVNGEEWPPVGGEIDLPEDAAASMVDAGHLELVKRARVEKRPAAKKGEEKR